MTLPLTGKPLACFMTLNDVIRSLAENDEVLRFEIGRTHDLRLRESEYALDCNASPAALHVLYESSTPRQASQVEAGLVHAWIHHAKCANRRETISTKLIEEFNQFVYVALWL